MAVCTRSLSYSQVFTIIFFFCRDVGCYQDVCACARNVCMDVGMYVYMCIAENLNMILCIFQHTKSKIFEFSCCKAE